MKRTTTRRALVGLLAGLAPLTAAAQSAPKIFYACYTPFVGTVYRIKEPRLPVQCFAGGTQFQWTDGVDAIRSGDAAGGDLAGTYPNPLVAKLQGRPIASIAPASGQVLAWNGTTWAPATPSAGVTAHSALTGLLNDDHTQYLLADGARSSVNGFAVTGTPATGSAVVSGPGTRLIWIPGRAALRAGMLDQDKPTAWDDINVGSASFAAGVDVTASGQGSMALGGGATASGVYSRAFGSAAVASGDYATAIGPNTTASGNAATAAGSLANASAQGAMALGERVTASGMNSTAIGYQASTDGQDGSFVYGDHTFAGDVTPTGANQFVVRASGGFYFRTSSSLLTGCNLPAGSGSWDCTSSVSLKTAFEPVDGEVLLARVRELPVQRWSYRTEPGVRHIGTFAEDFHRAFGLGTSATSIGMLDMDGVNLAAVQALEHRTRELQTLVAQQNEQIRELRQQLTQLSDRLARLQRIAAAH